MEACSTEYVLIISSHVLMENNEMIQNGIKTIINEGSNCLGFCINASLNPKDSWSVVKANNENLSPFIGLSNSCAFLRVKPILNRPFSEEVFSAEDQEWAAYQVRKNNAHFFIITSNYSKYLNSHTNNLKKINEEISLAYYTFPQLRGLRYIVPRFLRGVLAFIRNRPDRAKLHFAIAKGVFLTNFKKPIRKSSYY